MKTPKNVSFRRISMLKNHPRGLQSLFLTEIWERFGFCILMVVLVLYKKILIPNQEWNADFTAANTMMRSGD